MSERRYFKGSSDGKLPRQKDPLARAKPEYDVIVIGSGLAGLTAANILGRARPQGDAARAALQLRRHGHLVQAPRRARLRHLAARLPARHGQDLPASTGTRRSPTRSCGSTACASTTRSSASRPTSRARTSRDKLVAALRDRARARRAPSTSTSARSTSSTTAARPSRSSSSASSPGATTCTACCWSRSPTPTARRSTIRRMAYGIVFSNFMSKGVFTFSGGTDALIGEMKAELVRNGVEIFNNAEIDRILVEDRRAVGIAAGGRRIGARAVISNASFRNTVFDLVGPEHFDADYLEGVRAVRLNNSSCQVYLGFRAGELAARPGRPALQLDARRRSTRRPCATCAARAARSRSTTRRRGPAATAARWSARPTRATATGPASTSRPTPREKARLVEDTLVALERYLPDVREAGRPPRGRHAAHLPLLHAAPRRAPRSAPSSRACTTASSCRARSRACATPARSGSSCPAGSERPTTA